MNKKVICYIQAFDCENTIEAAMESIRKQTYDNWLCFVLSNGNSEISGNHSLDIIKNISYRDKRFIVINKQYNDLQIYVSFLYYLSKCFPQSYICSLDADDEYEPDFFARAVELAEKNKLEIVACGTTTILKEDAFSKDYTLISKRAVDKNLIIRGKNLNKLFPTYKSFLNEMWGKLYSTDLIYKNFTKKNIKYLLANRFVPDTLFAIYMLSKSNGIGILSGTSHKFYQFVRRNNNNGTALTNSGCSGGIRFKFFKVKPLLSEKRFCIYFSYDYIMNFLSSHGKIGNELYDYMQAVLFGWINDFYNRTLLQITNEAKIAAYTKRLVFNPKFYELMTYTCNKKYDNLKDYVQRKNFCEKLKYFLICQPNIKNTTKLGIINLNCTRNTIRKLNKIIYRLDEIIKVLSEINKGE